MMEHCGDSDMLENGVFSQGMIFISNSKTKDECLGRNIFEIPIVRASLIEKIKVGMFLFLFDYEERKLYGVFEATSDISLKIIPCAFSPSGNACSAQVCFDTIRYCDPLTEDEFRGAIKDNHYEPTNFLLELSQTQVIKLLRLFIAKGKCIQQSYCGTNKFSLDASYPGTSDDVKKHVLMSRNYESRNKRSASLDQTFPPVSSGLEQETSLYSTFSALEEPEVLMGNLCSSSREDPGNYFSPHLQVKRSFIESLSSDTDGSYALSLPDQALPDSDICYIPHEPYHPINILSSSRPPNDIQDRVIISGIYDRISESDASKTDPTDSASPKEFDHPPDHEILYGKQKAHKEIVSDGNHSYLQGSARDALAYLARNGQSALEMLEQRYPAYLESQRQLPPRILRRVLSNHQCESERSRKMKEVGEICSPASGKSKNSVATPTVRTNVFSRLSGRRTSPEKKTVKLNRQLEKFMELSSRKKNLSCKSKSQRVAVEDTEGLERSSSVDRQDGYFDQVTENQNVIGRQPAISFKRRSEWKKAADQQSSVSEREDGELVESKPKRNKLKRPSFVNEEYPEKQNVSHSTRQLSAAGESDEARGGMTSLSKAVKDD